jgi:hypothetical protein
VGVNGTIVTSPDGITWTNRASGNNYSLSAIAYGNNLFVAVGPGGAAGFFKQPSDETILTSPDGLTWTSRTSGIGSDLSSVAYGNNQFVAVGTYIVPHTHRAAVG